MRLPAREDTYQYGLLLARLLRAGDLIVLTGPLGAGKTVLVQGIAAGLEVHGQITSPTFVIARVHRSRSELRPGLVHVDLYRLGNVTDPRAEVDDLDLDATLDESVTVVEWGAGVVEQLAEAYLEVRIDRLDDDTRVVELVPHGGDWARRLGYVPAGTDRLAPIART